MDKRLSDFDKVMSCLLEPLGDYAPKRRYLLLDYNDSSGADLHHEALQYVPRGVTDRDLVRLFWEDLARQGYRLSSICEPQEDGGIAILYAAPGFLEECFSDQGLPVPDDIPAGAGRAWLLYGGRVLREGRPQVCRCVRFSDAPPAQQSQTKVSATVRFPDGWHQAQRGSQFRSPTDGGLIYPPIPLSPFMGGHARPTGGL